MTNTGCLLGICLEKSRVKLENWNKMEFSHVGMKVTELQKRLEWLEFQPSSPIINRELLSTRVELNHWLDKKDDMWRQRSSLNWFQSGDRNTSFFHAKASAQQKENFIKGIMDVNEVWQEDDQKIEEVVVTYYKELFTTSQPIEFSDLLHAVQPKVTTSMNQMLTKEFSAAKVKLVLK